MERETSQSDRERQTQASWTLVLSALLQPALQTRRRGKERETGEKYRGSLEWHPTSQHSAGRLCFPDQRNLGTFKFTRRPEPLPPTDPAIMTTGGH